MQGPIGLIFSISFPVSGNSGFTTSLERCHFAGAKPLHQRLDRGSQQGRLALPRPT